MDQTWPHLQLTDLYPISHFLFAAHKSVCNAAGTLLLKQLKWQYDLFRVPAFLDISQQRVALYNLGERTAVAPGMIYMRAKSQRQEDVAGEN